MKKISYLVTTMLIITLMITNATATYSENIDYCQAMIEAALNSDEEAGISAQNMRNEKIDDLNLAYEKISYADLLLLAQLIHTEAGSAWLSEDWKMAVGEVVLNRVASPEFPDTLEDCIFQTGQYSVASKTWFEVLVPFESCLVAAAKLLSGERVLNDETVVFQSGAEQGSGVHTSFYDEYYGTTYFCFSSRPELY